MSIVAYGYGLDPTGAETVDLADVELSTPAVVVELESVARIVDLPDDLVLTVSSPELVVTVGADLEISLDSEAFDAEGE